MIAIIGALAVALAAVVMLLAAVLVRHPTIPTVLRADTIVMLFSLLVTALFAAGVALIVMNAQQTAPWQIAIAGSIVIASVTLPFIAFRKFAHYWESGPPKAPVVDFPEQKKPVRRKSASARPETRRAA